MKSTHNTTIAYAKGIAAACAMAAGTALLMAWAGDSGSAPLQNYSQRQLDAAANAVPDQLMALQARLANLHMAKNMPTATRL